jgi:signal transduction histidine kinase
VHFIVDDDGPGIPDDVAKRATEPFFSTRLGEGGSGLGLTIAREIVNHHAGNITLVRREGGAGTRATITIAT